LNHARRFRNNLRQPMKTRRLHSSFRGFRASAAHLRPAQLNSPKKPVSTLRISAAQRVEHYEIAAYGCVRTWAGLLGEKEAENLLQRTLDEEKETDQKLTELSQEINVEAVSGRSAMQEEGESEVPRPRAKSRSAKA
jgi:uncharacterized protein DUF892